MATLMEKDVLLEYAHIGHLLPEKKTPEARQDSIKMGKLRKHIMMSEPQTLDFKEMVQKIRDLRTKYEKTNNKNEMAGWWI